MKKGVLSLILFFAVFIAVYIIMSFALPALRIKLEAPPFEYFAESLCHMALIKLAIAAVLGAAAACIPLTVRKRK